jgi:hypothetical protein
MNRPPTCQYCGQPSVPATGVDIYPHRPDLSDKKFYRCVPCHAYVGCHVKTGEPFGSLANATLRKLRNQAHAAFDPLWLELGGTHGNKKQYRTNAYSLLAKAMDISVENCHIAVFDEDQCREVINLCNSGGIFRFR